MSDWSGGYVTEVSYPYSYRSDMNPVRIRALLTLAGYEVPTGSIVCELGFGQGVAINIHACTQPDSLYVGTDFSPVQTGFAQTLQQQTGAEMLLVDESFEQFCQREDLPSFDFIVAHGIWSWVSEENRRWIEQFVAKRLKVGGAFVFSYNALPGWSVFAPVRDFMLHYADKALPSSAPITDKLNAAMRQVERMAAIPAHLSLLQHPLVEARLQQMRLQDPNHLVHEYFNRDWQPMMFPQVASRMQALKLDFVGSANPAKHLDSMNHAPDQLAYIQSIADPVLREYTKDLFANTDFRVDIWVKGKRALPSLTHANRLAAMRFVLIQPLSQVRVAWVTPRGEAEPDPQDYSAMLSLLSDYQAHSVQALHDKAKARPEDSFAVSLEMVKALWAANVIAPAQSSVQISTVLDRVQVFNRYVIEQSLYDEKLAWLASPITGGAISLSRRHLLCLLALRLNMSQPEMMLAFVHQVEQSQEASLDEIQAFKAHQYPFLVSLCALS